MTYSVYRGTSPLFVPDAGSEVASGLTGTAFTDPGPLLSGTEHFYVVRAVDAANGRSDGNLERRSAVPTGPLTLPGTRIETFEGDRSGGGFDLDGWSHAASNGGSDWEWQAFDWVSPYHNWLVQPFGQGSDKVMVSPVLQARAGSSVAFFHRYEFFPNDTDGATLEVSSDLGASWSVVPDAAFRTGGFTGVIPLGTANPLAGLRGWTGASPQWSEVQVDLSAWAGSSIQLRWRLGADDGTGWKPWYLDSVTFGGFGFGNSCQSAPQPPLRFHTVLPCRLVDTRDAPGPFGGPSLQQGETRSFALTGRCGVPATAKALSLNVTVDETGAAGFLTLFPGDQVRPVTSTLNYALDQTRANNAVLALGDGTGVLTVFASDGPVHLILDVNGYFE